ncbi:UNVERIFIED_CONTAM: hypothetical protein GTU68_038830 [Idotea baltica]|nr:hypothetical protein [Idotea baltica]
MELTWIVKSFNELSLQEMYDFMVLRQEVFVVEQDCPYLDCDGKDQLSHHVLGYNTNNELVAYTRLVKPNVSYTEVSIGRVITAKKARKLGAGIALMTKSVNAMLKIYGNVAIRISAQCYLERFYTSFGFIPTGKEYLEDGIPHMEMLRAAIGKIEL